MQEDQQQIMGRQAEDNRIRKESTSDSQEEQTLRKSTSTKKKPQRYEPGAGARPSPRKRRSIRSQAARANGKKAEEWQIWKQGEGWVKADTRRK